MPLIKIEVEKGKYTDVLPGMRDSIMDCVVESLHLPSKDRNIRIIEYPGQFFRMKPPYEILIEIMMFSGRTKETKKKLYESVVEKCQTEFGIEKEKIFIVVNEQPPENWGVRGGIPASDISVNVKFDG